MFFVCVFYSWGCVSHRHHCPLFVLLYNAQCSPDVELQHVCAAALLAFSIQNECQIQIDAISGIATLLRLLESTDAGLSNETMKAVSQIVFSHTKPHLAVADLCVYAAATMWNLCKSPLLMLKLEVSEFFYDLLLSTFLKRYD